MRLSVAILTISLAVISLANAQGPPQARIPGATAEQTEAIAAMNASLQPLNRAVATANSELSATVFSGTKDEAAINAAIEKLKTAQLAVAKKRSEEFAKIQSGPNKLSPEQVTALVNSGRGGPGGFGPPPGGPPAGNAPPRP